LTHHAQACVLLGQPDEARERLREARALYSSSGNTVGEALVTLAEAQILAAGGDAAGTALAAAAAEGPLAEAGVWRRLLLARWLRGDALRRMGEAEGARTLLEQTLADAEAQAVPQVVQRCLTSLGLLDVARGETARARTYFQQAIDLVEMLRAPLPGEEFRTAFVADKLVPYDEMVRLCLAEGSPMGIAEALGYVERSRSQTLLDTLRGALSPHLPASDPFEAALLERVRVLQEELNWFYSQMNRPQEGESERRLATMSTLQAGAREREREVLDATRRLRQGGVRAALDIAGSRLDLAALQGDLGTETVLVEYASLDGALMAFVVTDRGVDVVTGLGSEQAVGAALEGLHFQLEALRYGAERVRDHLTQLTRRALRHLTTLYDLLLRPLEGLIGERRLVVAPHRALHYIPFHALHDGTSYVVERREVCTVPSAGVLRHCLDSAVRPPRRAVLLGLADAGTPRVRDEVLGLAPLFDHAVTLLDGAATRAALLAAVSGADVVHLAAHGRFRPDNPLFSSLQLGDGWLTVRDAASMSLHGALVALSACETGVSAVAPGEELIGLARGFLTAGAPTLLVSLWTVDDDSTATLMFEFYKRLCAGARPAAALRDAQRTLLRDHPHPYYWSPFVLVGRW